MTLSNHDAIAVQICLTAGIPSDQVDMLLTRIARRIGPAYANEPTARFLSDMEAELRRARTKFPGDRITTIALAEEFGELAKALLDETGSRVWREAVQTAVMAARVAIDGDSSIDEWRSAKSLDDHRLGHQREA